eukprot:1776347-Prymnesium_polylepis.1
MLISTTFQSFRKVILNMSAANQSASAFNSRTTRTSRSARALRCAPGRFSSNHFVPAAFHKHRCSRRNSSSYAHWSTQ